MKNLLIVSIGLLSALPAFAQNPPAINPITASYDAGRVTLTWTAPEGNPGTPDPVRGYDCWYRAGAPFDRDPEAFGGGDATQVRFDEQDMPGLPGSTETRHFSFQPDPGVTYFVGILYLASGGKSDVGNSNGFNGDEPPPPAPPFPVMGLRVLAGAATDSSVVLAWDVTPPSAVSIRVLYSIGNGPVSSTPVTPISGRMAMVSDLSPGTTYTLRARVRNDDGIESGDSESFAASTTPAAPGSGEGHQAACAANGIGTIPMMALLGIAGILLAAGIRR